MGYMEDDNVVDGGNESGEINEFRQQCRNKSDYIQQEDSPFQCRYNVIKG